jgi:hypothetical protein
MLHTLCFSLENAVYFRMLPFLVLVLFMFYILGVLKSGAKRLRFTLCLSSLSANITLILRL